MLDFWFYCHSTNRHLILCSALDAIYLSGDGNFERSVKEFARVIKPEGICISCSGVVPEALRRDGFGKEEWDWLRDGNDDLKAGSFVLRRK